MRWRLVFAPLAAAWLGFACSDDVVSPVQAGPADAGRDGEAAGDAESAVDAAARVCPRATFRTAIDHATPRAAARLPDGKLVLVGAGNDPDADVGTRPWIGVVDGCSGDLLVDVEVATPSSCPTAHLSGVAFDGRIITAAGACPTTTYALVVELDAALNRLSTRLEDLGNDGGKSLDRVTVLDLPDGGNIRFIAGRSYAPPDPRAAGVILRERPPCLASTGDLVTSIAPNGPDLAVLFREPDGSWYLGTLDQACGLVEKQLLPFVAGEPARDLVFADGRAFIVGTRGLDADAAAGYEEGYVAMAERSDGGWIRAAPIDPTALDAPISHDFFFRLATDGEWLFVGGNVADDLPFGANGAGVVLRYPVPLTPGAEPTLKTPAFAGTPYGVEGIITAAKGDDTFYVFGGQRLAPRRGMVVKCSKTSGCPAP